ncbi:MAG TPA: hypothetical protein VF245_12720 [Solirubrobacterales bacterium]
MPATDIAVVEATLKEGWTQDNLEVQFLKDDELMKQLGVKDPDELIGDVALTAVHTGRAGGFTMVGPNGSRETNAPDGQKTAQAKWTLRRAFNSVEIDTAAIKRTGNNSQAVAKVVDTEVSGKISDTQKQIVRQLVTDQSGFIVSLEDTEGEATVLPLQTSGTYGLGVEATRQQWLPIGQQIDIGTKANEVALADGREITAYDDDETTPTITISGAKVDTEADGKYFVSIKNSRSGETSYSMNGFRNLCDPTVAFGELKPEDEPGWVPAFHDSSGGALTRERVVKGRRKVRQRGVNPDWAWTSLEQVENLENELFPQVRYQDPNGMDTGDGEFVMIGKSLRVQAHEDCPDGDFTYVKKEHVAMIRDEKPYWLTQKFGNGILMPQANSTFLYGSLEWYVEFMCNRRNAVGNFTGLE